MTLLDSLLDAIVRLDGEALVMHTGEKPYVVLSSVSISTFRGPLSWGQVELSSRALTGDAVLGMLGQMLSPEQRQALNEIGAIEHEIDAPGSSGERFIVTAARGGDDVWVEVRRHKKVAEVAVPVASAAEPEVAELPAMEVVPPAVETPAAPVAQLAAPSLPTPPDAVVLPYATAAEPREAAVAHEAEAALSAREAALAEAEAALVARQEALATEAAAALAAKQEALASEAARTLAEKEAVLAADSARALAAKEDALASEAARALGEKQDALAADAARVLAAKEQALAADAAKLLAAKEEALASEAAGILAAKQEALASEAAGILAAKEEALASEAAGILAAKEEALASEAAGILAAKEEALASEAAQLLAAKEAALTVEAKVALAAKEAALAAVAAQALAAKEAALADEAARVLAEREAALATDAKAALALKEAMLVAEADAAFAARMAAIAAGRDTTLAEREAALAAEAARVLAEKEAALTAEAARILAAKESDAARVLAAKVESLTAEAAHALAAKEDALAAQLAQVLSEKESALAAEAARALAAKEEALIAEAARVQAAKEAALAAEAARAQAEKEAALAAEAAQILATREARALAAKEAELDAALAAAQAGVEAREAAMLDAEVDAAFAEQMRPRPVEAVPAAEEPPVAVVRPIARPPLKLQPQAPSPAASTEASLVELLRVAAAHRASTLYALVDTRPMMRVEGQIALVGTQASIAGGDVERFIYEFAPRDQVADPAPEWTCTVPGVGRVRCVTFHDQSGAGLIFHLTSPDVSTADEIGLGREVQALCGEADGLIVVAGPRFSGKSTLLSAFVDLINRTRYDHVITIESQIRVLHEKRLSFISQREVRGDGDAIAAAARAALREGPDVLVIEDLRAPEALVAALDAARAGRLVFGTISAQTAPDAVERLIDAFPADRRSQTRAALAGALRAVVAQTLVRKKSGGRVAAREVLFSSAAVRKLLLDGATWQLPIAIESGRNLGMNTMIDALGALVRDGVVEIDEACAAASDRRALIAALARDGVDVSGVERRA